MPVSGTLQNLRVRLGYVNSGNSDMGMFIINIILLLATAIAVGLIWTLYDKKEGVTDAERRDMLFVGIIASIILFLMLVPVNISRALGGAISRHPIYFVYFILSVFLLIFVGIYHKVVDSTEQKGYIIAILITLGIIAFFSILMWWWTSHPYSEFTPLEILGNEDYYTINNELYTKDRNEGKMIEIINKFLDQKEEKLSDSEFTSLKTFYGKKAAATGKQVKFTNNSSLQLYTEGDKQTLEIQLNAFKGDLMTAKRKNTSTFYALARFKEKYDEITSKRIDTSDKIDELKTLAGKYQTKNSTDFQNIFLQEPDLFIQMQKEGILTPDEYNKYLGYYNPYSGGSAVGLYGDIEGAKRAAKEAEAAKGKTQLELDNQKAKEEFKSTFNKIIGDKIIKVKDAGAGAYVIGSIGSELEEKLKNYVEKKNKDGKKIDNVNALVENYIKKFTDCGKDNDKIDFTQQNIVPKNNNNTYVDALIDCIVNKKLE